MKKFRIYVAVVLFMLLITTSALAIDYDWTTHIYDWRVRVEYICKVEIRSLGSDISRNMQGGRPEILVLERMEKFIPHVMAEEVDDTTAHIIIKSIVHSFFKGDSYQIALNKCSTAILNYNPDGKIKVKKSRKKAEKYERGSP